MSAVMDQPSPTLLRRDAFAEALRAASALNEVLYRHKQHGLGVEVTVIDVDPGVVGTGPNAIPKCTITIKGDTDAEAFAGAEHLRTEHKCTCQCSGVNEYTCNCP